MEAQNYAGKGKVYSQEVDVKDVAWIDTIEGQYAPTPQPQQAERSQETKQNTQTIKQKYTVYQGRGATAGEIYNDVQFPVFGKGQYYAFDEDTASMYGNEVTKADIEFENPLIITNPKEYGDLIKKAGVETDNPAYFETKKEVKQWSDKIRNAIVEQGYDGIVLQFDSPENASDSTYDTLYDVFGHDQIIKLETPTPSKPSRVSPKQSPKPPETIKDVEQPAQPQPTPQPQQASTQVESKQPKKKAIIKKEPWQMTKSEFDEYWIENGKRSIEADISKLQGEIQRLKSEIESDPNNPINATVEKNIKILQSQIEEKQKLELNKPSEFMDEKQLRWHMGVDKAIKEGRLPKDYIIPNNAKQAAQQEAAATNALPDTEQELSALVSKMEEQQKQGIKIDLQLFAEAKDKLKKISQFRTNTLERTQKLTDKEREILDPEMFGYDPEKVDEWRSEAEYDVENAYELTKKRIESATAINGGVQAYEAALITQKMLEKARQTGDYTELKEWLPKVAEKTREAARALTATRHAYNPKSPAAAIVEVQRAVDNVNKEIADSDPQIKTDQKKIKDVVNKAQREAGEKVARDIETLSPEELLARRIQAHLNEATDAEIDPIKDMVNELYRVAQESPLPDNKTTSKRDPMEFVVRAVKTESNMQMYSTRRRKLLRRSLQTTKTLLIYWMPILAKKPYQLYQG